MGHIALPESHVGGELLSGLCSGSKCAKQLKNKVICSHCMVYLDYNSTTPVDPRVLKAMVPTFSDKFGNSSSMHGTGREAFSLVDDARAQVAESVGMRPADVIFTSGATEANNLALSGLSAYRKLWILVGATEHKSILQTCGAMKEPNHRCITMPVNRDGVVDLGELETQMASGVDVVSLMAANSETGVLHPWEYVGSIAKKYGALFHCDATQAIGKVPFDAGQAGIDMVTLSSHKIYGPKGCGALVATRDARKRLNAIIRGGGQEKELRSGTLNVPAIVGFGAACKLVPEGIERYKRQEKLRDDFEKGLAGAMPGVSINGAGARRLPNTSNLRVEGVLSDALVSRLPTVEIATGSACSSDNPMPSHVLLAMGLDDAAASESFRVSLGRETTQGDIETAVTEITETAHMIRRVAA